MKGRGGVETRVCVREEGGHGEDPGNREIGAGIQDRTEWVLALGSEGPRGLGMRAPFCPCGSSAGTSLCILRMEWAVTITS